MPEFEDNSAKSAQFLHNGTWISPETPIPAEAPPPDLKAQLLDLRSSIDSVLDSMGGSPDLS